MSVENSMFIRKIKDKAKNEGAIQELERLKDIFQQYYDGAEDSYWISICIGRVVNRLKELQKKEKVSKNA